MQYNIIQMKFNWTKLHWIKLNSIILVSHKLNCIGFNGIEIQLN